MLYYFLKANKCNRLSCLSRSIGNHLGFLSMANQKLQLLKKDFTVMQISKLLELEEEYVINVTSKMTSL